jgi:hypothetical protein
VKPYERDDAISGCGCWLLIFATLLVIALLLVLGASIDRMFR